MPAGIEVVVEEGFATIDFVDGTLRGPGLAKLLEVGTPPEAIEKLTREGPRAVYVVPEGNAREAGLLDEATEHVAPADGVEKTGTEAKADGSTTELNSQDSGGPYQTLPAIENLDGTALDPQAPTDHEGTAVGDPNQEPLPTGDFAPKAWPDGDPELDWRRPELDAYAASKALDTKELPNKEAVFAAITKHAAEASAS